MKRHLLYLSIVFSSAATMFGGSMDTDTTRITPWLGEWEGTLYIYKNNEKPKEVKMEVRHFTTDTLGTYGWFLIYGEDKIAGRRSYFLKTIDEDKGHYTVDEKNSIFLDTYMIGNKMISTFDVEGSLISSIYTLLNKEEMMFEIIYSNTNDANISGGSEVEDEEIPKVLSYKVGTYQKAILKKKT